MSFAGEPPVDSLSRPQIAVLDFTGDKSVSLEQRQFLSGKFADELIASNRFVVLDRSQIETMLQEQGFQQSGACSATDCRVQMGQLLGVDKLISGSMVRFGEELAFRIEYLDVATGRVVTSVGFEEKGTLEAVYKQACVHGARLLIGKVFGYPLAPADSSADIGSLAVKNVAPDTVQPKPQAGVGLPKVDGVHFAWNKKTAIALWSSAALMGGGAYYLNNQGLDDKTAYLDSPTQKGYQKVQDDERNRNVTFGAALGATILGLVFWFLPIGGN